MSLKRIIEKSDIDKANIPSSYQILGDIMLIKFKPKIKHEIKEKVARAILNKIHNIKTVCEIKKVVGEFRQPKTSFLAGNGSFVTIHKEHGILYKLDVSKIMFSKGNLFERQRLIKQIGANETIVDMFAGIGYFSLGLAKFSGAKKIYAIEKNPVAFEFLKENIKLNKIKNIRPILGDCKKISEQKDMQNIADRVIMGYLPNTRSFLSNAFKFLKPKGIVHYHDVFRKDELWKKPIEILNKCADKNNCKIKIISKKIVKSYAPNVEHVVIDVEVSK